MLLRLEIYHPGYPSSILVLGFFNSRDFLMTLEVRDALQQLEQPAAVFSSLKAKPAPFFSFRNTFYSVLVCEGITESKTPNNFQIQIKLHHY